MRRLLAFCAVTFTISWGTILLLIGPAGIALDADHLAVLLGFGYVGMLLGTSIAALVLTAMFDGRSGLRTLGVAVSQWRTSGRVWVITLLTAPLSILVVLFGLSLVAPEYRPRLVVEEDRAALLGYIAVSASLTGVFEELGWTGFAVRSLIGRHGVVRTGLIVGLVAGAWSLPIVYVKELSVPTPGGLSLAALLLVGLFTWQVAYRVLMVWIYERTRSVLMTMLMQTSLVAAWTGFTPLALDGTRLVVFYLLLTAIWCAVAMVALRKRGQSETTGRSLRAWRAGPQSAT